MSAARAGEFDARARALTAHRVRVLRLAAGTVSADDETTIDEEAGALLEAEAQWATWRLLECYAEVHKER